MQPKTVTIVGAGIVGVSAALFLQKDGHIVTLIDQKGPAAGASYGNAGGVVTEACAPLGMPGILLQAPSMMLSPTRPLILNPRYLPFIAPWLFRLLWNSRRSRVESIANALSALNSRSEGAWRALVTNINTPELFQPTGWLRVFETTAGFEATAAERALMANRHLPFQELEAEDVIALEPGLAHIFTKGLFFPNSFYVANPGRLINRAAEVFVAQGGKLLIEQVTGFGLEHQPYTILTASGGHIISDVVVVAAGAWSGPLAEQLGVSIPLDTERGYHLMLPKVQSGLSRPVVHGEHMFALSPMEEGIRLSAHIEFSGLSAPPDFTHIRKLLGPAKRMVPALDVQELDSWLGFRPSMPDSLPIIGPIQGLCDVYLGFGHGHYGLTNGPITGKILADLIANKDPGIDLTPYSCTQSLRTMNARAKLPR